MWLSSQEWLPFYRKASYGRRFSHFYSFPLGQEGIEYMWITELMRGWFLSCQCNTCCYIHPHPTQLSCCCLRLVALPLVITQCFLAAEMRSANERSASNTSVFNSSFVTEIRGDLCFWLEHLKHGVVDHEEFGCPARLCTSSVFFALPVNEHKCCVGHFNSRMLPGVHTAVNKSPWMYLKVHLQEWTCECWFRRRAQCYR